MGVSGVKYSLCALQCCDIIATAESSSYMA